MDLDGDGSVFEDDCDDNNKDVNPEAAERCDGVDNDCDGEIDEVEAEDVITWYMDADGDGYGDAWTTTASCTQPEGSVRVGGDCDDRASTTYPGAAEICDDEVVNDCEGDEASATAECGLGGVLSLSGADLKLVAEAAGDRAGSHVAGAGDVDGDGLDDLLVGAPYEDSGAPYAGAAYLLLGGGALTVGTSPLTLALADLKLAGGNEEDFAGAAVSSAGDVDGDGLDEVLISAIREDSGGAEAGAAYLLMGGGALAAGSSLLELSAADLKLIGEADGDEAGFSVGGLGDVDGDGLDDILIGTSEEDSGGTDAGAAYLLMGGGALASGVSTLDLSGADAKLIGEGGGDEAGFSVGGLGDVDGDGVSELLIGAPYEDGGGEDAGAAYLLLGGGGLSTGASAFELSDADRKLVGEDADDRAGFAIAGAGDVDGDGLDDLLVGAPFEDSGGDDAGAAYLLLGGGALSREASPLDLSAADTKLTGETFDELASRSAAGVGDVDRDGLDDLLIGVPDNDSGGSTSGAAYLLLGGGALATGPSLLELSAADVKLSGESAGDFAGMDVSGPGDVDGDGFDDLLVGAFSEDSVGLSAGAAYLVRGGGY